MSWSPKAKKIKKQFLIYWDSPHQWKKELERRRKTKFYKKESFNKKGERNTEENITTN